MKGKAAKPRRRRSEEGALKDLDANSSPSGGRGTQIDLNVVVYGPREVPSVPLPAQVKL